MACQMLGSQLQCQQKFIDPGAKVVQGYQNVMPAGAASLSLGMVFSLPGLSSSLVN